MFNMAGWAVSAVLGLASLAGWTHSRPCPQAEDFETYRLGANTQLVQRLEQHAGWWRAIPRANRTICYACTSGGTFSSAPRRLFAGG